MMQKMIMVRMVPDKKALLQVACIKAGISLTSLFHSVAGVMIRHDQGSLSGFDKTLAVRIVTLAKEEKEEK